MNWYQLLAIASASVCLISCMIHGVKIINYGKPKDYSKRRGDIGKSIGYSYTGAMSPTKKESAYLHLPTYIAGLSYHMGTFLSLFLFVFFIIGIYPTGIFVLIISTILIISGVSGLGILIKRVSKDQLRTLSNPDDYISNLLVTLIQFMTVALLYLPQSIPYYFILVSIFFLYLPIGKLKHVVYFFAARYHLGFFYGWRGVWPPK